MDTDIIGLMKVENNGPGMTLNEWIRLAHKKNDQTSETSGNVTGDNIMSKFDFENAVVLAKEITKAFMKIHNLGVIHNNVTTENIIVNTSKDDSSFLVKVIYLGLATSLNEHNSGVGSREKVQ
eukprot:1733864-Ditylum_brightwellii.AAC.1